ncbi:MAG: hypothetical protein ABFE13_11960 [Phycisphaerales bacterium]
MRTERVNRYYCDFCKKSGCSAYHIRRHEERCTLNPGRKCGMPHEMMTTPEALEAAVWAIPDVRQFAITTDGDTGDGWTFYSIPDDVVDKTLADLEDRLDGCPVCVYSALRQAGWAGFITDKFDLEERIAAYWSDVNQEEDRYSYGY